jgi:hypothetical protein
VNSIKVKKEGRSRYAPRGQGTQGAVMLAWIVSGQMQGLGGDPDLSATRVSLP